VIFLVSGCDASLRIEYNGWRYRQKQSPCKIVSIKRATIPVVFICRSTQISHSMHTPSVTQAPLALIYSATYAVQQS